MKRNGPDAWLVYGYRLCMLAIHFAERVGRRTWQRLRRQALETPDPRA